MAPHMPFFDMPPSLSYYETHGDQLKALHIAREEAADANLSYKTMYKMQHNNFA
jgi:hypothetical protein